VGKYAATENITIMATKTRKATNKQLDLDNLVEYTHKAAAWSDRHSNVAMCWNRPQEKGLQRFQTMLGWQGERITDSLLNWRVFEADRELPVSLESRVFRPDKVTETDTADDLRITATASFPARNALAVEIEVVNLAARKRQLRLEFDYPGKGVKPDWKGPFPTNHIVSIDNEPEGSWATVIPVKEHGRNMLWVSDFAVGMLNDTTVEFVCLADLSARKLTLKPRGKATIILQMAFGVTRGKARNALAECASRVGPKWTSDQETARWRKLLGQAQPLPPKYRGDRNYQCMYAHAVACLHGLFIQGEGGYTGYKSVPWTTKSGLSAAFFWDTAFSSTGAREFSPTLAMGALECFAENAGPRGSLPGTIMDSSRAGEGQAPIMCWSAWLVFESCKDRKWLARVYPALAGNIRFWFKYHCSERGMCQFFNAGQIADNDARFDPIQKGNSNQSVSGMESPDINAFLVMEMKCLARMAKQLGLAAESKQWQKHAKELGQLIVDLTYFADDAMFYDVAIGTRKPFTRVKNPNMFLPLWAGVPLPKAEIKRVIEKHMLNPNEFYRELPFPSLSYDHPEYNPKEYWRGRIWPHVVFWMTQTLWKHGYHKQAEWIADRMLNLLQGLPWFMENYDSGTGKDVWPPPEGWTFSSPEYNWSCATVIELLLERYKEPLP